MKNYALLFCLALSACGPAATQAPPPAQSAEGREETQNIRNTENIGVSGDAIANRVDQALDANEQHNADLKKAEEAAGH